MFFLPERSEIVYSLRIAGNIIKSLTTKTSDFNDQHFNQSSLQRLLLSNDFISLHVALF